MLSLLLVLAFIEKKAISTARDPTLHKKQEASLNTVVLQFQSLVQSTAQGTEFSNLLEQRVHRAAVVVSQVT